MKRIAVGVLIGLVGVVVIAGCDEEQKRAEILAKTAPEAAPVATATEASAVAAPEPPKKEVLCPKGPDLEVTDKDLEAELRLKLGRPKDALRMSDLSTVKSLNLTKKRSLDELDPCIIPKLTGLHHLYLGPGKLRDLSPIANLTRIESLRASINEVEDLKPLEKLVLLDRLDLGRTHVRDLAPLAALVNLTELQLDDTQVSDLAPLATMKKLEKLSIKRTNVTDVSPLKGLEKLRFLYVEGCAIGNLDSIQLLVTRGLRIVTK